MVRRIEVRNWFGDIVSSPQVVVEVESVDEIVAIVTDPQRYPSPVRAVGSNHSTTACGAADGGTLIVTRKMNRILEIRGDTVTAQAGALYMDVNQALQRHNLQFHVNTEIGNLTMGAAATVGTKDSSMPGEFGQVASYATSIKMVTPAGDLVEITDADPEVMQAARSSYGLFGIVYEVTFKVRPLAALRLYHERFTLEEFTRQFQALKARGASMMLYMNTFLDTIMVEFREYHDLPPGRRLTTWQWKLRDYVWAHMAPHYSYLVTKYIPSAPLRALLINAYDVIVFRTTVRAIRGENTLPQGQQIRYPSPSTNSRYNFGFWAFPEDTYLDCLKRYFEFCRGYYRRTGYRIDLLSVGYCISEDQSSLFSYSYYGNMITFDPVSTGGPGWEQFVREYNALSSELGGVPLLNQTNLLTRAQVEKALGDRLLQFDRYRRLFDPGDRLLNTYFRDLLAQPAPEALESVR